MSDTIYYEIVLGEDSTPTADFGLATNISAAPGGVSAPPQLIFTSTTAIPFDDMTTGIIYEVKNGERVGGVEFGYGSSGPPVYTWLNPDGTYRYDFFYPGPDYPNGGVPVFGEFDPYTPCFATGTLIATEAGQSAVEDLRAGETVMTLTGPAEVAWIGHRRARNADVIRVRAGTLGAVRDLIVSDDHALLVGGCLVPAGLLVDGAGIVRERRAEVTFWHVELERHAILLAEGVRAESYLDTGNRRQFGNCPLSYDPMRATQDPCAEMVLAGTRLAELVASLKVPVPA